MKFLLHFLTVIFLFQPLSSEAYEIIRYCGTINSSVPAQFCIVGIENYSIDDVVYYFHGSGGDEREWAKPRALAKSVFKNWEKKKSSPVVVSVSFGKHWFLAKKNKNKASGLFEVFQSEIIPTIEQKIINHRPQNRMILGRSMGGFNGGVLVLNNPEMFSKVALISPALFPVSPYSSEKEVREYVKRTGASSEYVGQFLRYIRSYFPSEKLWKRGNPLDFIQQVKSTIPSFYISCGGSDEFGLYEGSELFYSHAYKSNPNSYFQGITGGHYVYDAQTIADFLN